jgi:hypothetical protein
MSSPASVSPTPSRSSLRSSESPVTTGRGLALVRESALEPAGVLPPLVSEMRGNLNLARLRAGEGVLLRPEVDLAELLFAEDFPALRELLLEEVFKTGLDRREGLLFDLAVDFVGWRAMVNLTYTLRGIIAHPIQVQTRRQISKT